MPSKPRLGQNFLNDAQAIQQIASSLGDLTGRTVVEIGPGAGAITSALVARAAHVIAVELDPGLAADLRAGFPADKLTVHQQDVLHFDFAAASAQAGQQLLVFGNLPYYITSQIVLKLAASRASLDRAVLMVQREVAERITSPPGSRDYGLLSVTAQLYGPATSLFTLPPRPSRRRPTSTPPSSAGGSRRALPSSASTRQPFSPSSARSSRRSARRWPITCAAPAWLLRSSPAPWPKPPSTRTPAPNNCPLKLSPPYGAPCIPLMRRSSFPL